MRLFLKNVCVKTGAFLALALSFALIVALSLPLSRPLVSLSFKNEENIRREYALHSASSSACFSYGETLSNLLFIRGETAIIQTEGRKAGEAVAQQIVSLYDAELKLTERVGGGVSYYCYSAKIGLAQCKIIGGEAINLHIYVSDNEVRAGVPLIFGGY